MSMRKRKRDSIVHRTFIFTTSLLFAATLIIYFVLYMTLPMYYQQYKKYNLLKGVEALKLQVKDIDELESEKLLDSFSEKYNLKMVLVNKKKDVLYSTYSPFYPRYNANEKPILDLVEVPTFTTHEDSTLTPSFHQYITPIDFKDDRYYLLVIATLQPINEVSSALLLFTPYALFVNLLISAISSYFYSKALTSPLIQLNRFALRLSKLDFDKPWHYKNDDEIGQLANTLNTLSVNLQQTMRELKTANKKLTEDIEKERDLEIQRSSFVAAISHDLKTPITAVKGQIEGMMYNIGAFKDRDKYLQKSYQTIIHMESMVQNILNIYRETSEVLKLNIEPTNVSELLLRSIEPLKESFTLKQLQLVTDIEPEQWGMVDRSRIATVFNNLISNSLHYTPQGGKIIIELHPKEEYLHFSILNTGGHIPEDQLAEIFKPFYRIEKSRNRNTGGSGLGLYLVKRSLESHRIAFAMKNVPEGILFELWIDRYIPIQKQNDVIFR